MEKTEVLVAFPVRVPSLTQVRTTVLLSSQEALRTYGHYDAYVERLEEHRSILTSMYAAPWTSVDVAEAHYRACNHLALPRARILDLGRGSTTAANNGLAATALRMSRELGASPWTLFEQAHRFWSRAWNGSAISVERVGPKDARILIAGHSLAAIPYFQLATAGFAAGVAEFVAKRAYVREIPGKSSATTLGFDLSWA
jgi:hypothetical protein